MGFLRQMFMLQPNSIIDALQQELWKATMADEFSALMRKKKKKTWSLASLPNERKAIGWNGYSRSKKILMGQLTSINQVNS